MAEIDHIPGEHIPQGVIPQKRVGQYSFLIRSYAIYKGQGKTLDGTAHIACGNGIIQAAAPRRNVICIFFCGRNAFYNRICSDDRKCAVRTAGIGDVSFDDVCTGARKNI